ncbi:MAG TPA: proteasome subunit alpha, partial [Acidimicrobiales bacterium]|nr:proteasome subunit alpha [Acidimicrobiales bacterium]
MSMPFYVAPEQVMKDRADYARKGIARGRSLAALVYDAGVLLCAENPSNTLHKVAEIYDRIAFAGVGKYNEFDQLRKLGVRTADLTGYQFSREDVNANSLANQYAQILGNVFTHEMKPLEVEILVVEVAPAPEDDQLFHILYDGTVMDEDRFSVLGGEAEAIADRLEGHWQQGLDLPGAIAAAVRALAGDRTLTADDELFHILYDGTVMDEDDFSVLGGEAEAIADRLEGQWQQGLDLTGAV